MNEFLDKVYYGNTIYHWGISLGILLAFILLAKIAYWVIGKALRGLTSRTKTKLDDLIIDKVEQPAIMAIILSGFLIAFNRLVFPENTTNFIHNSTYLAGAINITWMFVRIIDALMEEYLTPYAQRSDNKLDDQLIPILRRGIRVSLWILGIIVGLNNAGFDVAALIAGLGIGGLAVALAAQDTVKNIFGGMMIFMDKPFRIGDRVVIDGMDGVVEDIGLRSTRIRQLDGRLITMPNGHFSESPVLNITKEPQRRINVKIGLVYGTSDEKLENALEILRTITKDHPLIDHSKTVAFFESFGEFSLNLSLFYFIEPDQDNNQIQGEINQKILTAFRNSGIEFAYPTQVVFKKEIN